MGHKYQLISKHWTVLANASAVSPLYRLRWGYFLWRDHLKHSPGHCHVMSNVNRMLPRLARNIGYSVLQNQSPPEHGRTHMAPVLLRLKQEDWVLKLAWSKQDAIPMPKALENGLLFIETRLYWWRAQSQLLHTWMVELCMSHIHHAEVNKGIP